MRCLPAAAAPSGSLLNVVGKTARWARFPERPWRTLADDTQHPVTLPDRGHPRWVSSGARSLSQLGQQAKATVSAQPHTRALLSMLKGQRLNIFQSPCTPMQGVGWSFFKICIS